jgi:hypothetical protein
MIEIRDMKILDKPYQCGSIKAGWEKVKGYLTLNEAQVLYDCAKLAPSNGQAVELGSYYGRSSLVISQVRPLFCIDNWTTGAETSTGPENPGDIMPDFIANIAGTACLPIRGQTVDVGKTFAQPIAFLFIDASHDYESVRADMDAWLPKLIPGAIVVFHDYQPNFPGVVKAVGELSKDFKPLMKGDACIAFKFVPPRIEAKQDKKLAILLSLSSAFSYMLLNEFVFSFCGFAGKNEAGFETARIQNMEAVSFGAYAPRRE